MERSRTCLPSHRHAPGGLRLESSVHGARAESQPRFQENRVNFHEPGGRWPSYSLHTGSDAAISPAGSSVPLHSSPRQAPLTRYGPHHRHTRHESFNTEGLPATHDQHLSNRRSALGHGQQVMFDQDAGSPSREVPRLDISPSHRSSSLHRRNVSRQDGSVLRVSVPLFKHEHTEGQNTASTGYRALTDFRGRNGDQQSNQLGQELHFSRRSWVQDAIKPGRYGYGRIPFAFPLHKVRGDGGQRFKRHPSVQPENPETSSRKQKRKVAHLMGSLVEKKLGVHHQEKPAQEAEQTESEEQVHGSPQAEEPDTANHFTNRKDLPPGQQQDRMQDSSEGEMNRRNERRAISAVRTGNGTAELESEEKSDVFLKSKQRYSSQGSSEEDHQISLVDNEERTEQISESEDVVLSQWDKYRAHQNVHVNLKQVVSDSPTVPGPTEQTERNLHLSQPVKKWGSFPETIPEMQKTETISSLEHQMDGVYHPRESLNRLENDISADMKPGKERENIRLDLPQAQKESKMKTRSVRSTENWTTSQPTGEPVTPTESLPAKNRTMGQELEVLNKQSSFLDQQQNQNQHREDQSEQRTTQLSRENNSQSHRQGSQQQLISGPSPNGLGSSPRTRGEVQAAEEDKMPQHPQIPHQYSWPQTQLSSLTPARQRARPRIQRQHNPSRGGYISRAPQSLFQEVPSIHRHGELDTWPLHGGDLIQPHGSGRSRSSMHASSEVPQWNLYHPGTESYYCEGEQRQYKACSQEPCPAGTPDPRVLQCATLNKQEFMGRLYEWEPFTEVRGSQRCELNCRPMGYRFYVRHKEKVQNGTPCEASSTDICVAGQCLRPGCDGILDSNARLDSCGMCGGDSSTCHLIAGIFNDSNMPIGYQKILQIPRGATKINVTENSRSPNYLALRRRSGKSVINGNWAVDPPGTYEAEGTVFTYTRPSREDTSGAESFTAPGPTTELLDVYMIFQQDNPGISYSFFLPHSPQQENHRPASANPQGEPSALTPLSSRDLLNPVTSVRNPLRTSSQLRPLGRHSPRATEVLQRQIRIPPLSAPPVQHWPEPPKFYWKRVGNTECTVTCGKGSWIPVFRCISHRFQEEVDEKECDAAARPVPVEESCNTHSCPAYWDTGEWAACSSSCGPGVQHRQISCRQVYANRTTMVHPERCVYLEKPNATQPCHLQVCSHWEIGANWSSCSVPCGQGRRTRHVRCVSNQGNAVSDRECNGKPRPMASEACDMGTCVKTWFHSDWSNMCSAECGVGIQRRTVVCLSSHVGEVLGDSCTGVRPADMRACDSKPCPRVARWYTGPWSQCSAECDGGVQRRDVICISKLGSEFNVTDPSQCAHLEKPATVQPCATGPCGARWFTTPWSTCSQSCLGGLQVREVRCLTGNRTLSDLCDPHVKPAEKRSCNTQPCTAELDENCKDRHHSCPLVVQARLCAYAYYKGACCASCTHALERSRAPPTR